MLVNVVPMTWTTPQPVPHGGTPALLPPGPLSLGDIAGGAWRVYKARFGLFLKLLLMPFLIMFGITVAFGIALLLTLLATPRGGQPALGPLVGLGVVFYITLLVVSLLVYVYQGRTAIAGIDLATGRTNPTSSNLADRTRGLLGRLIILVLLAIGLSIAVMIAIVVIAIPIGMASDATGAGSGSGGAGGALFAFLLVVAFYAALFWLSIKLLYTLTAMAEEQLDAIPAIKRSFQLTKGAFWKTLGYQIVLGLIGMAIVLVPYLVAIGIVTATTFSGRDAAANGASLVGIGVAVLIMYAAMLLYVPYQYLFTALMYLSRGREQGGVIGGPAPTYPPQGTYTAATPEAPQDPYYPANPWGAPPTGGPSPQG